MELTRIPVFANGHVIELADSQRVKRLLEARNARPIHRKKDHRIVEVHLENYGDDRNTDLKHGDPRKYSHNRETKDNPNRCWTLRHLPGHVAPLFRLSVTDNLK
jgi:hypothetical protein